MCKVESHSEGGGLNLHKRQMEERERNKKADKYREGDMGEWSEAGVM